MKNKKGNAGSQARWASKHQLIDELRALTTKHQLDEIMKSRMNNNHLEQLIGWYKYVRSEKKTKI